ncbi:MAG TPA: TonB-dependent receptor [Blastocatellia bacterium]|nr:TonB-dependent receptor [Blastocatellia bacterium]
MTPKFYRFTQLSVILAALGLTLLAFGATSVAAQSSKATIVGTVRDAQDAVIPGAKVTVTNVATNQVREVETNSEGDYIAPDLQIGTYKVEASAPNFSNGAVDNIILQVGDRLQIDVTLPAAGASEVVTVNASEAPLVQTETSSRGDVITGRQLTELPLSGRNFTQLAVLSPGVSRASTGVLTDQTQYNQGNPAAGSVPGEGNAQGSTEASRFARSGGASISANGQRSTNNNFSLDGVDNNESSFGTIGVYPAPDAIAEFKIETSVPRAEVGRATGAVVNTTFRSGTNEIHGSAYYYGQNSALNATSPILNGKPANTNDPEALARFAASNKKTVQQINEFGFTAGGPIIKDRWFIFGDYLGQRNNLPIPISTAVPTALSRMGNFSEFDSPVINPQTGNPFPNNIIPNLQGQPGFSGPAFTFLNDYPLPTVNIRNPSAGNPNFFSTRANTEQIDSFDIKTDATLTSSNTISGRYSFSNQSTTRANFFPVIPTAGFGAGDEFGDTRQVAISDVQVFSPTWLNEARFGWTRINIGIFNCGVDGACGINPNYSADIGIPNVNRGDLLTTGGMLTGGFGTGEFEFSGDGGPFIVNQDNFYYADTMTVVKGPHTIKFGFEYRDYHTNTIDGGRSGNLKGHLQYAAGSPGSTGNVQADYLLGTPAAAAFAANVPGGAFNLRQHETSFFVQDDWKVTPNLTVNYGLRYDLFPSASETDNRISNYDPVNGVVVVEGSNGNDLVSTDKNNFGPRIGAAYAFGANNSMVIRGGYGLIYTLDGVDYPPLIRNPPFTQQIVDGPFNGGTGVYNLTTGPPLATTAINPLELPTNYQVFYTPANQQTAYAHQWNLTYEWGFAENWAFNVAYVGTRANSLLTTRDIGNNGLGTAVNYLGQVMNSVAAYENRAKSWYDGLQTQVQRRFSNGWQFRANYTWSKTLDQSNGVFDGAGQRRGAYGGPQNPLDTALVGEKGISGLNVTSLFSADALYELPFGAGKKYLNDEGWVNQVVGGWQLNTILTGRTGQPFTVAAGDTFRASLIPGIDPYTNNGNGGQYLNPDAFADPNNPDEAKYYTTVFNENGRAFLVGDTARNAFTGPGYFRVDASFLKNFPITESIRLEFGMQFFNLFNSADYVVPSNDIHAGDFGSFVYTGAQPARVVQYRFRVIF